MKNTFMRLWLAFGNRIGYSKRILTCLIVCSILIACILLVSIVYLSSPVEQTQNTPMGQQQNKGVVPDQKFFDSQKPQKEDTPRNPAEDSINITVEHIKGGLGVSAVIKNNGDAEVSQIPWSIEVTRGKRSRTIKVTSGTISSLAAGEETLVQSGLCFGFGKVDVTVTAAGVEK